MKITIDASWRVNACETVDLPFPAAAVWSRMRNPAWFLARDPLHQLVRVESLPERAEGSAGWNRSYLGARVVLKHRLFSLQEKRKGDEVRGMSKDLLYKSATTPKMQKEKMPGQ